MPTVGLVTFDTLAFVKKMVASGMPEEQAEALASAQAEIITNSLATKDDLALYYQQGEAKFDELDAKIDTKFNELAGEIKVLDVKFEALNEKIESQGKALNEKIESQGKALNEKIESQGKALNEKIESQGKALENSIIIKLGGLMVVLFGLFFALLRAFPL